MFTDLSLPASRHDGVREADAALAPQSDRMRDFANSRLAADKVVYFTTWPRCDRTTWLERPFDPDRVPDLKAAALVLVGEVREGAVEGFDLEAVVLT